MNMIDNICYIQECDCIEELKIYLHSKNWLLRREIACKPIKDFLDILKFDENEYVRNQALSTLKYYM